MSFDCLAQENKKKHEDLMQFNNMLEVVAEEVAIDFFHEESVAEKLAAEAAEDAEFEVEQAEGAHQHQHQQQADQSQKQSHDLVAGELAPENMFSLFGNFSSAELLLGIFTSFTRTVQHAYEAHQLKSQLDKPNNRITLVFPNGHIARQYLDFLAQRYPGLQLHMMPGTRARLDDEENQQGYRSAFAARSINPFTVELKT